MGARLGEREAAMTEMGEAAPMIAAAHEAPARGRWTGPLTTLAAASVACAGCGLLADAANRWRHQTELSHPAVDTAALIVADEDKGKKSEKEEDNAHSTLNDWAKAIHEETRKHSHKHAKHVCMDEEHWQDSWSDERKEFCCSHHEKFCKEFDCEAGFDKWQEGWSAKKKDWCCEKEDKGCVDFDCDAGYDNWEDGWSDHKKKWCCKRENKGCEEDEKDDDGDDDINKPQVYGDKDDCETDDDGQCRQWYIINLPPSWDMGKVRQFQEEACKRIKKEGSSYVKCTKIEDNSNMRAILVRSNKGFIENVMKSCIKFDPGFSFANSQTFAEINYDLGVEPKEIEAEEQEDGSSGHFGNTEARRLRSAGDRELVELSASAFKQCYHIKGTKCVEYIQSPELWGLDRIEGGAGAARYDDAYEVRYKMGWNVHVYVMDTGIKSTHREFRFFGPSGFQDDNIRAIPTLDVTSGQLVECQPDDRDCAVDKNGHGTHVAATVAGTIYGVAKYATVHSCKVLDDKMKGSIFKFMKALDWVTTNAQRPAIISASLSGKSTSASLERMLDKVYRAGITVVVAAGNNDRDACDYVPGMFDSVITVGAIDKEDARASFSNSGSCLDIFAPGKDVKSAGVSSMKATAVMSGTSMAAPHVTGVLALIQYYTIKQGEAELTPEQLKSKLMELSSEGMVTNPGDQSPNNLLRYVLPPLKDIGGSAEELLPAPTMPPTPAPTETNVPTFAPTAVPTIPPATPWPTPMPTMSPPFEDGVKIPWNCQSHKGVDYAATWPQAKRDHCCNVDEMGCPQDPYDCEADYPDWAKGWSLRKKQWCCKAWDRGC